ncbi:adenine phosphoribosyltransferase [Candidatus Gottesmanbacteria bacterium]|nr:adenine phosphoribosyltransferase [Candidatus Gottesmanbacteria bacterium]
MGYYELKICGLTRKLPIVAVGKNTSFANFSLLGDTQLINKVADGFAKDFKKMTFDYLVGPEVKVVPLIFELARRFKQEKFVVCRKSVKPYMVKPMILKPLGYFPKHVRQLVIDGPDAELLKNKKVVVLDDVVSTGVTMRMMGKLMEKVGAKTVKFAAVLKQGKQFDGTPEIFYLETIPVLDRTEKIF